MVHAVVFGGTMILFGACCCFWRERVFYFCARQWCFSRTMNYFGDTMAIILVCRPGIQQNDPLFTCAICSCVCIYWHIGTAWAFMLSDDMVHEYVVKSTLDCTRGHVISMHAYIHTYIHIVYTYTHMVCSMHNVM